MKFCFWNFSFSNGGALSWTGENGTLTECNFINNRANAGSGGAVYWGGVNGNILKCIFTNNSAAYYGGAIYWRDINGNLFSSTFINLPNKK